MPNEKEFSTGGSQIHRYAIEDFRETYNDLGKSSLEEIDAHITTYIGSPKTVLHEIVWPNVHVDIHIIEPTLERNFITLVTSGMSDKPMKSPFEGLEYAELMICLPSHWQLNQDAFQDERNYWVVRWLKYLARFPHEFDTWIWATHTIPNGDPPVPFAVDVEMSCALLTYPRLFGTEFWTLKVRDDKEIHFLSFVPIYKEEMEFKLEHGIEALYSRFEENLVCELLDTNRPNYCINRS
jgi:hypothetical protein